MPESNANYLSDWDIDQLLYQKQQNDIVLAANTSDTAYIQLATFNLGFVPIVDAIFQTSTDAVWRQMGDFKPTINLPTWICVTSSGIYLAYLNYDATNRIVNVRHYIWADRVDL